MSFNRMNDRPLEIRNRYNQTLQFDYCVCNKIVECLELVVAVLLENIQREEFNI